MPWPLAVGRAIRGPATTACPWAVGNTEAEVATGAREDGAVPAVRPWAMGVNLW